MRQQVLTQTIIQEHKSASGVQHEANEYLELLLLEINMEPHLNKVQTSPFDKFRGQVFTLLDYSNAIKSSSRLEEFYEILVDSELSRLTWELNML